ncbi:MAG TPA: MFS transporter [Chloroflexia bacterium]|nr:MFS transporter [Chloroflexia bacterium]
MANQEQIGRSDESLLEDQSAPVSTARLPKGVYNNFTFEFFNAVMWQSFSSPVVLFIRQAGASAFIVGALSAIPLLLMPLTLAGSRQVERIGYRRLALICWTLRWLFSGILIPVALMDWLGYWRVVIALGVVFLFHLTRNFGVSANNAWLTSIIGPHQRGLYLSRTQLFSNMGSVGAFLLIGAMLGSNPAFSQFSPVFVLGVIGGLLSSIFMARIAPPPVTRVVTVKHSEQTSRLTFWQGVKRCFAQPGFTSFVVVQTFYGVAFFAIPSLSLIYMREKVHIAPGTILYFSTAGVFGATLASLFWGKWIDKRGIYSLQLLAFLGLSFNSILWFCIGLFGATAANLALAALVNFLSTIWISALNMSQTHSIMSLAPDEDRVLFQNIATLMTYFSQALAPMLWGMLLDMLDAHRFTFMLGGLEVSSYRFFFLISMLAGLVGCVVLFRLQRVERKAMAVREEYAE